MAQSYFISSHPSTHKKTSVWFLQTVHIVGRIDFSKTAAKNIANIHPSDTYAHDRSPPAHLVMRWRLDRCLRSAIQSDPSHMGHEL